MKDFAFQTYTAGTKAFLDAFTSDLVPCKVLNAIKPGRGNIGGEGEIEVEITEDHKAYRKGDKLVCSAFMVVPKDQIADTPLFLMATAGVRLLSDNQRAALLNEICRYAQSTTSFSLPSCELHIQAIPGETEGLYGWIAANYLLGGSDSPEAHAHGKGHHTYGFLDMGGASAQIAFAPPGAA